jgi:hypothetical protein
VLLDEAGRVAAVVPRARLDAHRLIEEFMVAANVCAAEELERRRQPCMYRVHDQPSAEKLEGLRQFLGTFGISLPPAGQVQPRSFSHALEIVRGRPEERLVNEAVLRGQAQAAYDPENIGHFGLALPRYAHFTSPIGATPTCWSTARWSAASASARTAWVRPRRNASPTRRSTSHARNGGRRRRSGTRWTATWRRTWRTKSETASTPAFRG